MNEAIHKLEIELRRAIVNEDNVRQQTQTEASSTVRDRYRREGYWMGQSVAFTYSIYTLQDELIRLRDKWRAGTLTEEDFLYE